MAYVADAAEVRLLTVVGPAAATRGHYVFDELAEVAAWKSVRSKPLIARNEPTDVVAITEEAFIAADPIAVLTRLVGVGIPTASTLLTVARPTEHTIFDVRATDSLRRLGEWDGKGGYQAYLSTCHAIAVRLATDLRTLDRALWKWSEGGNQT